MPKGCSPCLSREVRDLLHGALDERVPHLNELLARIPDCPSGQLINLCSATRGLREKRAPSAYNIWIGSCMKGKNIKGFGNAAPAMKECAAAWQTQQGKVQA